MGPTVFLFVVGVVAVLGLTAAGASVDGTESGLNGMPTPATSTPVIPEMALSVKVGGFCADQVCTVSPGAGFTLSVDIVTAPSEGYTGAQSWVNYGDDLVYNSVEGQPDEVVWPDCEPATAVRSQFVLNNVSHGCLTAFGSPAPPSSYAGNLVDLSFNCSSGPSSTLVRLLPLGDDVASTSGAGFALTEARQVVAKVSDLTINCGDVPTATATPPVPSTSTPTSAPGGTPAGPTATPPLLPTIDPSTTQMPTVTGMLTSTPTPTWNPLTPTPTDTPLSTNTPATPAAPLVGDTSCDGVVNPLDAALILQFAAGLIPALPCPGGGDTSGDGVTNPLDAALILQFSAGLISTLPP